MRRQPSLQSPEMFFLFIFAFTSTLILFSIFCIQVGSVRATKKESTVCPVRRNNNNNVCFDTFIVCLLFSHDDLHIRNENISEEIANQIRIINNDDVLLRTADATLCRTISA